MKNIVIVGFLILSCCSAGKRNPTSGSTDANSRTNTVMKSWYVPDSTTALKIAEAIWLPIYGKGIYLKQPFNVSLRDSVWVVEGSLPEDMDGGVPYIEINGISGTVLKVSHGK